MRQPWCILVVAAAVGSSACAFKGEQLQQPRPGAEAGVWLPKPVEMRLYPATRFAMHNNEPVLEARVELLDAMRDPVKASGTFRFELLEGPGPFGGRVGPQLYVWDLTLDDLEDQQQHFDQVTRAYYFPLKLDSFETASRPVLLRVVFTPAINGERLAAERELRP